MTSAPALPVTIAWGPKNVTAWSREAGISLPKLFDAVKAGTHSACAGRGSNAAVLVVGVILQTGIRCIALRGPDGALLDALHLDLESFVAGEHLLDRKPTLLDCARNLIELIHPADPEAVFKKLQIEEGLG